MKLVILESPTKTKALTKYLGSDFVVLSSNGHINKLSKKGQYSLGIDLKTFKMSFEIDEKKKSIVKNLYNNAKKVDKIYIATDPDREGEAIAFHIENILPKDKKIFRVIFNEITPNVVKKSFENPGKLNEKLVESQFARRSLDRILGFRLSSLLQRKIYSPSAGRVQSVALSLIVNREKEIEKFIPEKFFSIFANWKLNKKLILINEKKEKLLFKDENKINDLLKNLDKKLIVFKLNDKKWIKKTPEPFKTSTLLQNSMSELNYSSKKVMFLVQQLYEGIEINNNIIGLITYPRTDSTRINSEFKKNINTKIQNDFGNKFLKKTNNLTIKKTNKQKIQDAHEAIRITDIELKPEKIKEFLTKEQFNLYKLIYNRTFSSFMSDVEGITRQYIFKDLKTESLFLFEEEKIIFEGFLKIQNINLNDINEEFLNLKENDQIEIKNYIKSEKITKPKLRYTESKMIKKMDDLGIGRPSTYSMIISKLLDWNYIEKNAEKKIIPTWKGKRVNDKLQEFFYEIINIEYTANMEKDLDLIAEGKKKRYNFLNEFYKSFEKQIENAEKNMTNPEPINLDRKCPKCNSKLQEREGKFGKFIGCSNFPECKFIEKINKDKKNIEPKKLDRKCPKCNSELVERIGRFGNFVACSNFPECKFIEKKNKIEPKKLDRKCPKCNLQLVERVGRFGNFISCSGFPKCKFIEKKNKNK